MAETGAGVVDRLSALRIDRAQLATRGRVRRRRRLLLAVLILVALAAALAAIASRPPTVAVVQVREARPGEALTRLSASGYVASRRHSVVAPKIAGRLRKVLVQEGQQAEEGQVLALLDDEDARVAVREAEARRLAAAAQQRSAAVEARKAQWDLARARVLARGNAIAASALQDAELAAQAAEARRRAAAAQATAAGNAVAAARLNLEHTVVRAPFTGTVVRKLADEGAVLAPAALDQPNVGGIVELVDLSQLEVEAEVAEDQLSRIGLRQPALVFLDAHPGKVFGAVTGTVRPGVDKAKGTAVVKVQFDSQPQAVYPGMGAKISFLSRLISKEDLAREPRLRVPASAVIERAGRQVVLVVEGGRLRAAPVRVGERLDSEVALLEGPPAGTRVVAAPTSKLHAGSRVAVKQEAG
jgi:RND family efflux transporter MFP subunit